MSTATEPAKKLWTSDDLFALRPSKKVDRWLFRGELRESKVTKRNPSHSRTTATVSALLFIWLRTLPIPRPVVYSCEAYFRLRLDPETNVGVDVALASSDQVVATKKKASYIDGPPLLAVEVLSPYDQMKDISEKIEEYLECGTPQVWILDPYQETLTIHRSNEEPTFYNRSEVYVGDDFLSGLTFPVAELFS